MEYIMTVNALSTIELSHIETNTDDNETFDIPIDISDIINICKEYSKLGWQIQNQIEEITEQGIEEAILNGTVKVSALPHIKDFLTSVSDNAYFGDAADQAKECISLIESFELKNPLLFKTSTN